MQTLHTPTSGITVHLTPENRHWLREKAHRERKSQALVLNEVLERARRIEAVHATVAEHVQGKEGGGDV